MLELKFKEISEDTREAMKESLFDDEDYYCLAVNCIKDMFECDESYILNSANSCLLTVAEAVEEPVLTVNQGGWNGFVKSCEAFAKKVSKIDTDDGLINIDTLGEYFENNDVNCLYITSLAGYTARQPIESIQKLCDEYDVILILDISASVGDDSIVGLGDIQVASTSSPKIVNIENGGFLNNVTGKLLLNKHLIKTFKADKITCAGIYNELPKACSIHRKTVEMNSYLKKKLCDKLGSEDNYVVIHPSATGLNIMITAESKKKAKTLAYNIRKRLNINGNVITTGPNYNRIKQASVIVETKNLDTDSINIEKMDKFYDIIVEEIEKMKK